MLKQDAEAFESVMRDLCLAFDRPYDDERTRVFWEALKAVNIHEVRRNAIRHRNSGKKFPTPRDLMPEKVAGPVQAPQSLEDPDVVRRANELTPWARAANLILYHVAYCDARRKFAPIGAGLLERCLHAKRDLVVGAEQDEAAGQPWPEREFNQTCRQAFERILGLSSESAA